MSGVSAVQNNQTHALLLKNQLQQDKALRTKAPTETLSSTNVEITSAATQETPSSVEESTHEKQPKPGFFKRNIVPITTLTSLGILGIGGYMFCPEVAATVSNAVTNTFSYLSNLVWGSAAPSTNSSIAALSPDMNATMANVGVVSSSSANQNVAIISPSATDFCPMQSSPSSIAKQMANVESRTQNFVHGQIFTPLGTSDAALPGHFQTTIDTLNPSLNPKTPIDPITAVAAEISQGKTCSALDITGGNSLTAPVVTNSTDVFTAMNNSTAPVVTNSTDVFTAMNNSTAPAVTNSTNAFTAMNNSTAPVVTNSTDVFTAMNNSTAPVVTNSTDAFTAMNYSTAPVVTNSTDVFTAMNNSTAPAVTNSTDAFTAMNNSTVL